jgi:hypothetical protein
MLEKFDLTMAPVLGEVQVERKGLVERMEDSVKELKEKNFNASQELCKNLFETLLEPLQVERLLQYWGWHYCNLSLKVFRSVRRHYKMQGFGGVGCE